MEGGRGPRTTPLLSPNACSGSEQTRHSIEQAENYANDACNSALRHAQFAEYAANRPLQSSEPKSKLPQDLIANEKKSDFKCPHSLVLKNSSLQL